MLNFTVGPVQSSNESRQIAAQQVPYFRTTEFSELMLENEKLILSFSGASEGSRAVFVTGSGTAAMEAAVLNVFNENDLVLVINGGSFGKRFADICRVLEVPYIELKLDYGEALTSEKLEAFSECSLTGLLINLHETSTGVLYDIDIVSKFCRANNLLLVVDAISSFLADPINMKKDCIDVLLTGSQKALACDPGVSVIMLNERAIARVQSNIIRTLYFDLKDALKNGERGQTPFTPAVNILRQINQRLKEIDSNGGVECSVRNTRLLAEDFRAKIKQLPLKIASPSMSNAVTPLCPINASAHSIFLTLKDEYGIWICPNGGELADKLFRVGHIGKLSTADNDRLVEALCDMERRGLL